MIHENMFEILTVICWFERLISGTDEQMNFHIKLIFFLSVIYVTEGKISNYSFLLLQG